MDIHFGFPMKTEKTANPGGCAINQKNRTLALIRTVFSDPPGLRAGSSLAVAGGRSWLPITALMGQDQPPLLIARTPPMRKYRGGGGGA